MDKINVEIFNRWGDKVYYWEGENNPGMVKELMGNVI